MKTYDEDHYIGLDQDTLKKPSKHEDERRLQDIFKMSSLTRMFVGESYGEFEEKFEKAAHF